MDIVFNLTKMGYNYYLNFDALYLYRFTAMALMYYDINYDSKINVLDPSAVMAYYLEPGRPVYDVNGDGLVDVTDTEVYSGLVFDP